MDCIAVCCIYVLNIEQMNKFMHVIIISHIRIKHLTSFAFICYNSLIVVCIIFIIMYDSFYIVFTYALFVYVNKCSCCYARTYANKHYDDDTTTC